MFCQFHFVPYLRGGGTGQPSTCRDAKNVLILVRCRQLGCSACFARRSFQIRIRSCARHRHIPYDRPACARCYHDPSARLPSERLTPDGSLDTGTLAEARDHAIWHYWDGGVLQWCLVLATDKTVMAKKVVLCSTISMLRYTEVKS